MSPEMTDLDLIPGAAAPGTLRGFLSREVFRQAVGGGSAPGQLGAGELETVLSILQKG